MPGFLSRFRRRATSLSLSRTTSPSQPQPSTSAPAPGHAPPPLVKSSLERKIHPDLNSLLASQPSQPTRRSFQHGMPDIGEEDHPSSVITPLRPSARRHSVDGSGFALRSSSFRLRLTPPPVREGATDSGSATPSRPNTTSSTEQPSGQNTISQNAAVTTDRNPIRHLLARVTDSATTGEWSTFGRGDTREHKSTRLGLREFEELGAASEERERHVSNSPSRVQEREGPGSIGGGSTHSLSTFTEPAPNRPASPHTSSSTSTPSHSTPASRATSHHATPNLPHTHPQTPLPQNSQSFNEHTSFSPHTFGYPTPPAPHANPVTPSHGSAHFTFGSTSSSPSSPFGSVSQRRQGSPPPPLPPLDHPAFRPSYPANTLSEIISPTFQTPDHRTARTANPTFPITPATRPRSRSQTRSKSKSRQTRLLSTSSSLPSLSYRRHSTRSSRSKGTSTRTTRTPIQNIFSPFHNSSTSMPQQHHSDLSRITGDSANATPFRRSRARTPSVDAGGTRRLSADFSAQQASGAGDVASETDQRAAESWEAQVAREMVRLSFGTGRSGGDRDKDVNHAEIRNIETVGLEGDHGYRAAADAGNGHEGVVTRGNNQQGQTQVGLGSPFLLQDTNQGNLSDHIAHTFHDAFGVGATSKYKGRGKEKKEKVVDIGMSHGLGAEEKSKDTHSTKAPAVGDVGNGNGNGHSASKPRTSTPPKPPNASNTASTSSKPLPETSTVALTASTPDKTPGRPARRSVSEPDSVLRSSEETKAKATGKRKADDVDGTPPDSKKEQRATFAVEPRPNRPSNPNSASSQGHAPSSYHRKRARLTMSASFPEQALTAMNTGSWSSRGSTPQPGPRSPSRGGSATRAASVVPSAHRSRRSLSQVSMPISALVSPHAPSISRSSTYHMRDPRRPPPIQPTPWSLHFPSAGEAGSPLHAWMFFLGFVLFPLWWVAGFLLRIPMTRRVGESEEEKGVVLDDPQVEHDAKSWRTRCRVMSVVSLVTYIPFIVLVAIYTRR